MAPITLITEDKISLEIVKFIFQAAKYPVDQFEFRAAEGRKSALKLAELSVMLGHSQHTVLLLDSDKTTLPDALAHEVENLKKEGIRKEVADSLHAFFAVPEIESWLFADTSLLEKMAPSENVTDAVRRLPLPEEISYPKQLAYSLLRKIYSSNDYSFLRDIDISKASARSFSLNSFLNGVGKLLGIENRESKNAVSINMDRRIFSNLIKEIVPSETIIYRTLDGTKITAHEMLNNIDEGSILAQQYTSDLLRIARDFLKRQANK